MLSYTIGIQIFFLIFGRVLGFFLASPFWNNNLFIFRFKNLIVIFVSYILLPHILTALNLQASIPFSLFWFLLIKNLIFGLILGFLLSLLFSIFQIVGDYWGFQIGFSMAQFFDPQTGSQTPILGELMSFLALLLFVFLQGHMKIIILLSNSLDYFPLLGGGVDWLVLLKEMIYAITMLFKNAIVLGMTLMGVIFVTTLFVGLVAKATPQLNVMLFGMPVYMIISFIILIFLMPNFIYFAGNYIQNMIEHLYTFIDNIKK